MSKVYHSTDLDPLSIGLLSVHLLVAEYNHYVSMIRIGWELCANTIMETQLGSCCDVTFCLNTIRFLNSNWTELKHNSNHGNRQFELKQTVLLFLMSFQVVPSPLDTLCRAYIEQKVRRTTMDEQLIVIKCFIL